MKRLTAVVGLILVAAMCAGCGSSGGTVATVVNTPSTVTATTTVVKTERSTVEETVTATVTAGSTGSTGSTGYPPADFHDGGNGVYSAFEADHDLFSCDDEDNRCWGVKVTAPDGCPNGVAVKLTIYPEGQDTAAATVEQTTSDALAPQEIKTIIVGSNKLPDDQRYEAEVTESRCA